MSQRRLLFVCYPDTNHPIGGVKQIYRQVELLHEAGWDAFVLQEATFASVGLTNFKLKTLA